MKKKKSPVKVVVPLILAVAAAGVGYKVVNRYIPSKEVMDGNEYFGTSGGEDAAVVLPDRLEQGKALVKDGTAYVEYATAKENLNDHLYKSDEEQQVQNVSSSCSRQMRMAYQQRILTSVQAILILDHLISVRMPEEIWY